MLRRFAAARSPRCALALALPLLSFRLGSAALVSPRRASAPPMRGSHFCQMPPPQPPLPPYLLELREELAAGEAQLFDVREPNEYAVGALAQSCLVPLSDLQVRARAAGLGPGRHGVAAAWPWRLTFPGHPLTAPLRCRRAWRLAGPPPTRLN